MKRTSSKNKSEDRIKDFEPKKQRKEKKRRSRGVKEKQSKDKIKSQSGCSFQNS